MNLFQRLFGRKLASATSKHDIEMYKAQLSIQAMKLLEEAQRQEMLKSNAQRRMDREIKSGIMIDPGGTCLCRLCGKGVSALYDHCDTCNATLNWNA